MRAWVATALEEQTKDGRLPFAVVEHANGQVIGRHQLREHVLFPNRNLDVGGLGTRGNTGAPR